VIARLNQPNAGGLSWVEPELLPAPAFRNDTRTITRLRCGSHALDRVPLIERMVPLVDAKLVLTGP